MRYLFFTNTPAHVHLYRHAVETLRERGHDVLVLGRDYGCTRALLSYHNLPHEIYGECGTTKFSLFRELPEHYFEIFRRARQYDPDLIFGVGSYAAHAGALTRTPVVVVADSEPTTIDHAVARPFVNTFLTPHTFGKDLGGKHYEFRGFKELAYLHPDVYEPDPTIRKQLGVEPDEEFAIVRFNAFGSHHDVGHSGFTPEKRRKLVSALSEHATVFVSDEGGNPAPGDSRSFDLHPARLHDALAEASLLVADTQTMVTEAALLGTPAIRSNSFVGESDMGNFLELEREGLIDNFRNFEDVLARSLAILADDSAKERLRERRDSYLADKVNLTDVIVDVATNAVPTTESIGRTAAVSRR
ncbi:hypothetical protein SAMN05421858_1771 [Haladaptatus litoreus]|uniref:DUF354 domain-containing protein n=1 Tax=Haladaptatus litoreus TaxID=553468 RepID=A0A1N6YXT1_9EURY|nr:DUF354 domain-containing protein [Haladaptatus litoreus]SIR19424.1 hypothetical protein SAMN05421858_1771 [Haladaptatus litoreus]